MLEPNLGEDDQERKAIGDETGDVGCLIYPGDRHRAGEDERCNGEGKSGQHAGRVRRAHESEGRR